MGFMISAELPILDLYIHCPSLRYLRIHHVPSWAIINFSYIFVPCTLDDLSLLGCCQLIQIGDDGNKSCETESPLLKQSPTVTNQQVLFCIYNYIYRYLCTQDPFWLYGD